MFVQSLCFGEMFVPTRCRTEESVISLVQKMYQQWCDDRSRIFVFGFFENGQLNLVAPDETSELADGYYEPEQLLYCLPEQPSNSEPMDTLSCLTGILMKYCTHKNSTLCVKKHTSFETA